MLNRAQALLPLLEKGGRPGDPARVINIGSIDGLRVPQFESYAYSASKAAVHHLTRALAVRLAAHGITVNAIAPGPFESKMMAETLFGLGRFTAGKSVEGPYPYAPRRDYWEPVRGTVV